jgi:hypothetical protein
MATRTKRDPSFHLGWGAILLAFLIAAALSSGRIALAAVFALGAVGAATGWAWTSGWRLRAPVWRLPLEKLPSAAEEERLASTRRVRDALIQLFHAKGKPAAESLRGLITELAAALRDQPEPSFTVGMLANTYIISEAERAQDKLRSKLEGFLWKDVESGEYVELARTVSERELTKQTPNGLGTQFFDFYFNYRLLIPMATRLAGIIGVDPSQDSRFIEWRRLDGEFTSRLREVTALPELASLRADFEEVIKKW